MIFRNRLGLPPAHGLYRPDQERDSCGVGFVANIKGKRSHQIVRDADCLLGRMDHRGARGSEVSTGDGAGILTALPHEFLARVARDDLGKSLPRPGKFGAGVVFLNFRTDAKFVRPRRGVKNHRCNDGTKAEKKIQSHF